MPNLENGISSYIETQALVKVFFPVDAKGNADISCSQCYFFRESAKRCGLNWEICQYPNKYVGGACPLQRVDEETGEIETLNP